MKPDPRSKEQKRLDREFCFALSMAALLALVILALMIATLIGGCQ